MVVQNTSGKDPRFSPFNPKFPLFKLRYHVTYVVTWVVTVISNLWSESISDKSFVGFVHGIILWGKNDSIESLKSDYLKNNGTAVIYHPFLNGREQLTKAEVKESQAICSVGTY